MKRSMNVTKNISSLDKVILSEFKIVEDDFAMATAGAVMIGLAYFFYIFLFLIPAGIAFICIGLYRMHFKLFYKTTFGETRYFFQSFPISSKEMVIGKLTTVFIVASFVEFVGIVGIYLINDAAFWELREIDYWNSVLGFACAAKLLENIMNVLARTSIIFAAISIYNTSDAIKNKGLRRLFTTILGVTIFLAVNNVDELWSMMGFEYALWQPLVSSVISAIVSFIATKITLNIFEKGIEVR